MGVFYPKGQHTGVIRVYVDSDWAGGAERKSMSAGMIEIDGCCIRSWSKGQTVTAQSSGEAEFMAIILGATEGLAVQSMLAEIGLPMKLEILSDSSAARAMCCRLGAGSLKRVQTRFFFIQQLVKDRKVHVMRVASENNPAHLGTKGVTARTLERLRGLAGLYVKEKQSVEHGAFSLNAGNVKHILGAILLMMQAMQVKGQEPDGFQESGGYHQTIVCKQFFGTYAMQDEQWFGSDKYAWYALLTFATIGFMVVNYFMVRMFFSATTVLGKKLEGPRVDSAAELTQPAVEVGARSRCHFEK